MFSNGGLTSTCIQSWCLSQTSAMRSRGSKDPSTVVPDVQLTSSGTIPFDSRKPQKHLSSQTDGAFSPLHIQHIPEVPEI